VEYFKQSKNYKRKHDAEELDSDSEIEISKAVSNSQKSKKKSKKELMKSILRTKKKTNSNRTQTTRRQVIEYRYFAENKY
jgi:hypothetical protein